MDAGKGWLAPGCPAAAHDNTIINRIMLRFRPIAPKPEADGSVSDSVWAGMKTGSVTKGRAKRKYVRVKRNIRKCKTKKQEEKKDLQFEGALVSFQNPEFISGTKVSPGVGSSNKSMRFELLKHPIRMNINNNEIGLADRGRVVESWVLVDGTAETLVEAGVLGSTDGEKIWNLEMDTCPGLISDGMGRVKWMNLAYKRMVDPRGGGAGGEPPAEEVVVVVVMKEKIPVVWPVFACTVRVVYTWQKKKYSRTMACDVWKMDFGGFAWRLDSKTALSLGR